MRVRTLASMLVIRALFTVTLRAGKVTLIGQLPWAQRRASHEQELPAAFKACPNAVERVLRTLGTLFLIASPHDHRRLRLVHPKR
jgi:hypothetical protein